MSKFKTKTIENFLSDDEINTINQIMATTNPRYNKSGVEQALGMHMADYWYMDLYENQRSPENARHKEIADILLPRFQHHFHHDICIDDCHIIETVVPYSIHSDTLTPVPIEGNEEAWTIIIPFDDFYSNTFIFEQRCPWTKSVQEWAAKENPPKLNVISDDMYERYFTHCYRGDLEYLTIHDMFPWRKGWCNGTARSRFHCSDNYATRGLTTKRGIVAWTSLPIGSVTKK